MMKKIYNILTIAVLMAAASACSDQEGLDGVESNSLTLSLDVVLAAGNAEEQTRSVGDPGLAEFFEKPQHLYLFLAVGDPATPGSNPVYCYQFETSQSKWTRSADSLVFKGRELKTVDWDSSIPLTSMECRAYMVASFDAITFNPTIGCDAVNKVTSGPTTESALLDLKFYAYAGENDYANLSLRDVYSSPYNLSKDWTKMSDAATNRTNYYGTVTDIKVTNDNKGLISINDTLYHTAAKVDFQWNAKSHTQSNVMVNAVVDNAPKQGYLFRPSETVNAGTYSKVLLNGGKLPDGLSQQVATGEKYIKVEATKKVDYAWDNQFWIVAKNEFQSGDTYEFSADIRADNSTSNIAMQIHGEPGTCESGYLGFNTQVTEYIDYSLDCDTLGKFAWSWEGGYEIPSVSYSWNQGGAMVISNTEALDPYYALQYWLVNGIELKAGDTYRLTVTCKAEGSTAARIRFKLGNWDEGDSHTFTIPVGGEYTDISFDVTPNVGTNGFFFQHGDFVGTIYWKNFRISHFVEEDIPIVNPTFSTQWQTYSSSGKIAASGQSIAFNLNDYASANNYYFKNISFKINGVEQVVNGDLSNTDVSSFFQKIDRGSIVPSDITQETTTIQNERDLNNNLTARYANATEVNIGNQWSGRAYTYVLQPGNLIYTLTTSQGGSHAHTAIRPASNGQSNDVFAAWYKLDFNILGSPQE